MRLPFYASMATVVTMLIGSPTANALLLKDSNNGSSGNNSGGFGGAPGAKANTNTSIGPVKPFLG